MAGQALQGPNSVGAICGERSFATKHSFSTDKGLHHVPPDFGSPFVFCAAKIISVLDTRKKILSLVMSGLSYSAHGTMVKVLVAQRQVWFQVFSAYKNRIKIAVMHPDISHKVSKIKYS